MKKICLILAAVLILTGCSAGRALVEETKAAIAEGKYKQALDISRQAIDEGCDDEQFLVLADVLEHYAKSRDALEQGDLLEAEEYFDGIEDFAQDDMAAVMTDAIDSLEEEIYALRTEKHEIDELMEDVKGSLSEGSYFLAESEANELLEKNLTEEQRTKAEELLEQAIAGQDDSGEPEANISKEQAIDIAKKALDLPQNAKVKVEQHGEYYIVNAEVDYGDFVDESGCMISIYDGEVFNRVG